MWVLLIMTSFFFLLVLPYGLSYLIVNAKFHFPDLDDGKTPRTMGLSYQEVQFTSDPGIQIRGWFVPALSPAKWQTSHNVKTGKGTVVLVHGLNRTRVEMLSPAVFLAQSGYNCLLFDLRHHGQSGGTISSLGYYESRDVIAALKYLEVQEHTKEPLAIWGVSMGAAASFLAFSQRPEVTALIADSPFLSFEDTIVHHAKLFLKLPAFPVVDLILLFTSRRLGFRPEDYDLRHTVRSIGPRPILFVVGTADKRMPPDIARTLYGISTSPQKELLIVEGAKHGGAYRTGTAQYQKVVLEFLEKNLGRK
jgi:pimeloyl-ACP methyl ester carboxylesterase